MDARALSSLLMLGAKRMVPHLAVVILLVACDGPPQFIGGPITGTLQVDHVTAHHVKSEPRDLTYFRIAAYQFDSEDENAEFAVFSAETWPDGSFEIADAPDNTYYLSYRGLNYTLTSRRRFNRSTSVLGRIDVVPPSAQTDFAIDLAGTVPWQPIDELQIFSSGSRTVLYVGASATNGTWPVDGAMDTTGMIVETGIACCERNLTDADLDDELYVVHMRAERGDAGDWLVAREMFAAEVYERDGETTAIAGRFTELPLTNVELDVRGTEFLSVAEQATSQFGEYSPALSIVAGALPRYNSRGEYYRGAPDVFRFDASNAEADVRVPLSYGTPYPDDWTFVNVSFSFSVAIPELTTDPWATPFGSVKVRTSLAELGTTPIRPTVTPIQNLTLAGSPIVKGQRLSTRTPVLAWDAPAVGNGLYYSVRILNYSRRLAVSTSFVTAETQVRVPPDILRSRKPYIVNITAISRNGSADFFSDAFYVN